MAGRHITHISRLLALDPTWGCPIQKLTRPEKMANTSATHRGGAEGGKWSAEATRCMHAAATWGVGEERVWTGCLMSGRNGCCWDGPHPQQAQRHLRSAPPAGALLTASGLRRGALHHHLGFDAHRPLGVHVEDRACRDLVGVSLGRGIGGLVAIGKVGTDLHFGCNDDARLGFDTASAKGGRAPRWSVSASGEAVVAAGLVVPPSAQLAQPRGRPDAPLEPALRRSPTSARHVARRRTLQARPRTAHALELNSAWGATHPTRVSTLKPSNVVDDTFDSTSWLRSSWHLW